MLFTASLYRSFNGENEQRIIHEEGVRRFVCAGKRKNKLNNPVEEISLKRLKYKSHTHARKIAGSEHFICHEGGKMKDG